MNKLLIYIGENEKFDIETTIGVITSMKGILNPRRGNFIGAMFECKYVVADKITIIRLSPEAETVTVEGLGDESLDFALKLQKNFPISLKAVDLDYNFNVSIRDLCSVEEFRKAISHKMQPSD